MPTQNVVSPPRPRLSSRERAARDAEIVASAARGRPQARIAAEHGLTVRQVQRVVASWRCDRHGDAAWIDPVEEIRATLELLRQVVADMAAIEERPDNDAAHIGASRLKIEAALRRQEFMQALGLLPRQLGTLRAADEMAQLFREFAALAEEHNVSNEYIEALHSLAERSKRIGRSPIALVAADERAAA